MRHRNQLGLAAGVVLFGAMLVVPTPDGLTLPAWRTAAVAVLMATWWISEAIPIAATALLPLVLFPLLGIAAIDAAAAPYANPVIYLFMGGFLIAAAFSRSGLHRRIAITIVRTGGAAPGRLVGSFMLATAFISLWVSNTATAAMMLPMALALLAFTDEHAALTAETANPNFAVALLLGVAYAATIGGIGTLVGTPPNALFAGFMSETYGRTIDYGDWMLLGVPIVVVTLPLAWLLLTRVLFPVGTTPISGGQEVITAHASSLSPITRAEWTVALVAVVASVAWISRPWLADAIGLPGLSDAGIAIAGALLLFIIPTGPEGERSLDWESAERLPWGVLVLFGGGLALASGIQETGLAAAIGNALSYVGEWPPVVVIAVVTASMVFLSELTSNAATAAAFLPVTTSLAIGIGDDPLVLAVATTLGASGGFMLPVATPPNAMVYGTGRVTMRQMFRAGLALNLLLIVVVTIAVVLLVPRVFE